MRELDIDLSDRTPQLLTRELAEQADIVVTMGRDDQCPYIRGKRYIDWELPDPSGQPIDTVPRDPRRDRDPRVRTAYRAHLAALQSLVLRSATFTRPANTWSIAASR